MIKLAVLLTVLAANPVDTVYLEIEERGESMETVDWLNKTIRKFQSSDPSSATTLAREALEISKRLNYDIGTANSLFNIGLSFWYRDLHDQAMEYYLQSLTYFEQAGEESEIARLKMNIGITYDELGQTPKAKRYIIDALNTYTHLQDSARIINGYLNLGVIYFYEEQYDSALYNFQTVEAYAERKRDPEDLALIHLNIGNVYEYMKRIPEAVESYRRAKELVNPEELLAINIDLGLGNALLLNMEIEEGLALVRQGLKRAKLEGQLKNQQDGNKFLKDYYLSVEDFERAFKHQKLEYDLDQQYRGEEIQEQVEVLQLRYEDEKKARELVELRADQEKNRFYLILSIVVSVAAILGLVLMFYLFKLRIKNAGLKERELRQELEHKNKELTSYTLNFIQKNELLNDLVERVSEIKKNVSDKVAKDLNQLNTTLKSHMRIDQDWENFKIMFEQVHEGFFVRLKASYPDLGNAELKLCALLRLNLNLKESSQILGISSDSVKTARSRLRKKLQLSQEDNLVDFMIMFDSEHGSKVST